MTFIPYNSKWRFHRKIMHQALSTRACTQYYPMQAAETHKYLLRIIQRPSQFLEETRRLAGSTIMLMAYGYEVKEDDTYVPMVEDAVYGLTQTLGVGFLVDVVPLLRFLPDWAPGSKFKTLAKEWRRSTRGILEMPWAVMMDKYVSSFPHYYLVIGLTKFSKDPRNRYTFLLFENTRLHRRDWMRSGDRVSGEGNQRCHLRRWSRFYYSSDRIFHSGYGLAP